MSGCNCGKDQTPNEVFDHLKSLNATSLSAKESQVGVALFLVPDPESGILEEKVVSVDGISYQECIKRGSNCIAFKWIPSSFKAATEVHAARASSCGQWCGPDRKWCPGLCFCGSGNYCR